MGITLWCVGIACVGIAWVLRRGVWVVGCAFVGVQILEKKSVCYLYNLFSLLQCKKIFIHLVSIIQITVFIIDFAFI